MSKRRPRWRLRMGVALGAVVAAMVAAGIAYATIPDGNGVFTACKLNATGTIRLIDPSLSPSSLLGHCTSLETQIKWNQQGQPGQQGPQGSPGADGAAAGFSAATTADTPIEFEATSPLVSLPVPAGKFVVTAVVNFASTGVGVNEATCYLSTDNGATSITQASDTVPEGPNGGAIHGYSQITLTSAVSVSSSATFGVLCVGEGTSTTATGAITAVQVSQLN